MTNVSMEELECGAFLRDAGICFADDSVLEASLIKGIETTKPTVPGEVVSNAFVPVSPEHTSAFSDSIFEPLNLLSNDTILNNTIPVTVSPIVSGCEITHIQHPQRIATPSPAIKRKLVGNETRKRKVDAAEELKTSDSSMEHEENDDRRLRNREHAKRSRYRKKLLTKSLAESVEELREETEKLREELYASIGKEKVLSILNQKKNDDLQKFLVDLKEPKNRIVSGTTLRFLKSLTKKIPKAS